MVAGLAKNSDATNAATPLRKVHEQQSLEAPACGPASLRLGRASWIESGGPPVKRPTRQGFGTHVIERMIEGQLNGEMRFDWRVEGLVCEIMFRT